MPKNGALQAYLRQIYSWVFEQNDYMFIPKTQPVALGDKRNMPNTGK